MGEHDDGKHVRFTTTGVSASMGYHLARKRTVGAASAMVVMIAILATKGQAALLEYRGLIAADGDRERGFLINFKKRF
ncbi:hypothetical protein ACRS7F_21730 [Brucella anthropi]|uniref:hypothetical protein n=1 Tax=Brucella anthropi TaxID=529 RepID=UPI003EE2C715